MLINALCEYADKSAASGDAGVPEGFSEQKVHFRVILSADGNMTGILDIRYENEVPQKNGKIKIIREPEITVLPARTQKTTIDPNIIEHRPLYIFGLNYENNTFTPDDKTNKARKSHDAFVKHELEFFEDIDSELCNAYRLFLEKWMPENEVDNSVLKQLGADYKTSYFTFGFADGRKLEEDEAFLKKYSEYLTGQKEEKAPVPDNEVVCAITGEKGIPARIHDKIKFPGGLSSGCVLVGMKESAYESYGKTQSFNSNISEAAMKKYTATLNKLLADSNHRVMINDLVIMYFAMKKDDTAECDFMTSMLSGAFGNENKETEAALSEAGKFAARGRHYNMGEPDKNVMFYVVGMTPNSSRICQKFLYRDRFGVIADNLEQHQKDLRISEEQKKQISFSWIAKELVSPKSSDKNIPPPLMSAIMLAALNGSEYPRDLLETVIRRVKTDSDEEKNSFIKLNDTRAGIIKACINRKTRIRENKEEFTMSLNTENKDPAYLCGRLFAVYEKIQQDASGGGLNRTIKDAYYSSACSTPSIIMPKLDKLSQNHIRKLTDGTKVYYSKMISEIMDKLEGKFPRTMTLDDQGSFIIGYYQQNKALYTPKNDGKEE